jgi:group I intron endonuclease
MGIIYLITSPSGKKYVGQTIQSLDKRWKQHIDASKKEYKDHCKVLNKSLKKYGEKHFNIEILEECDDEYLNEKEILYIEKYNTIVPNGMNIKNGGSNGKHHFDTKQKISDSLKGREISFETRLKLSNTKNPDLPMYMLKMIDGYRICNHPMGPEKRFISKSKSDEYNYDRAVQYLTKLNNLTEPILVIKSENETYIQKHKNGYCVKFPGEKSKYFVSKSLSLEELYKNALSYLNELKSKSAVQRLNGSG